MLTQRQMDCLYLICDYIKAEGVCPSFDEIGEGLGLTSRSTVHGLIICLTERGYIERGHGRARNLRVLKMPPRRAFKWNEETEQLEEM